MAKKRAKTLPLSPLQGWGFPASSRKAHYFQWGEPRSLCSKWLYLGELDDTAHESPDNCVICKRRHAALVKAAGKPSPAPPAGVR